MDLKEKLIASHIVFEDTSNVISDDIHTLRNQAIKDFEKVGFPSKKMEAWKYTSLNSVLKHDYNLFPSDENQINLADVKPYFIDELDTYKILFVDGKFNALLSETEHEKLEVCLLSSALAKPKYKGVIEKYFNKIAKKDNLTLLNTAFVNEGAFVYIPKNVEIDKPIEIIYFTTAVKKSTLLQPRNLIVVGQNAHVKIIEQHQSLSNKTVLTNSVTEIFTDKHATVDYYKIQNDQENASLVDSTYIEQQSESICSVHTFSFGGNITRNNLEFYQKGKHINSILKGISLTGGKQHVDHNTLVHHIEPNCESHQDYKGIYNDRSTGVFNGKVLVSKEAQKTNAYQQNNNILVSDNATINAKPQLEIFADDVKCSHGCTIGKLDEDHLFYMQQRGIPKKEAEALLMYAFANTVLESVKILEVKQQIKKIIARKLDVNLGFDL